MSRAKPLAKAQSHELSSGLSPSEPLWQRVPHKDDQGHSLTDFMMIIRGLKTLPEAEARAVTGKIQLVLQRYKHVVEFADLNLKLSVLWVSVRAVPGITLELPAAIHAIEPRACLVGERGALDRVHKSR